MKIVATIEARMESTRLPGKILMPLAGRPGLERLVDRVRHSKLVDEVIVATTDRPSDEATVKACDEAWVRYFRGSSEDVLDRVLKAAKSLNADLIVELTGDCPLLDPEIIDSVIQKYLDGGYDYVSNVLKRTFPRGMDTQVFSVKLLEEISEFTLDAHDRENVSLFIYEHPEYFKLGNVASENPRPDLRLTVDTIKDYELVSSVYENLYPQNPNFNLSDIILFLDQNPQIKNINAEVQQKRVR